MKKITLLPILLLSITFQTFAQKDNTELHLAVEKYLQLTEAQWVFDETMKQTKMVMTQQLNKIPKLEGIDEEMAARHKKELMGFFDVSLNWDKIKNLQTDLLMGVYSLDDINAINEFYASNAGRNMVAKTPEISKAQVTMQQQLLSSMQEGMMELLKKQSTEKMDARDSSE